MKNGFMKNGIGENRIDKGINGKDYNPTLLQLKINGILGEVNLRTQNLLMSQWFKKNKKLN